VIKDKNKKMKDVEGNFHGGCKVNGCICDEYEETTEDNKRFCIVCKHHTSQHGLFVNTHSVVISLKLLFY